MLQALGRPTRLPRDIRLLSLDVFDTALRRDCAQPEHIFERVEAALAARGLAVAGFADLRRQAEGLARETARLVHGRPEVTLEDIHAHLASLAGLPGTVVAAAKELEIDLEGQAVSADPRILDLFDQAGRAGIPVVFVSDMYLPREVITAMLTACGFRGALELFLSGERQRIKADGGLYAEMLDTFELAGNRVLHIGDHPHADGAAPAALGIRCARYAHRRQALAKPVTAGPAALALGDRKSRGWSEGLGRKDPRTLFDYLGRAYGPAIHGPFVRWVAERVRDEACDAVLFFSRDGFLSKRLYDRLGHSLPGLPPAAYCCVSRRSLNLARLAECDAAAGAFLLSGSVPRNAGQILARCGLDPATAQAATLLAEHGLSPHTPVTHDAARRPDMLRLLARLEPGLRQQGAAMGAALKGYLSRFGLDRLDRLALVDIGWSGGSQQALEASLADLGFAGTVTGLYLGLFDGAGPRRAAGMRLTGFLEHAVSAWFEPTEAGEAGQAAAVSPLGPVALLELLHGAPHGGVVGYAARHGAFRPEFAHNPQERRQYDQAIAVYQAAVLSELTGEALLRTDPAPEACSEAIADLCLRPTPDEAAVLGELHHFDGFEHLGDGTRLAPAVAPGADPETVRQAYARAYWKAGFLARNPEAAARAGLLAGIGLAPGAGPKPAPPGPQKTMLVLTHELSRTGAPIVLLNWLGWLRLHTDFALRILCLRTHGDLLPEFEAFGPVCSFYEDIAAPGLSREQQERALADFCAGPVSLIFGNTAVCAAMYDVLACLDAPIVTNVHELEYALRHAMPPESLEAMGRRTTRFVAGSPSVRDNLIANHGVDPARMDMVHESIVPTVRAADLADKAALRRRLGIPAGAVLVLGCGAVEERKGVDLFIEMAGLVRRCLGDGVLFHWIGAPDPVAPLDTDALAAAHGVADVLYFTGPTPTPKDYFLAGDLFTLPSREDCVSLAGLEACECGLPVVCFQGAGDLPAFVHPEAGLAVPHGDVRAMAEAVVALVLDAPRRKALGRAARTRLLATHVTDRAAPFLLRSCLETIRQWRSKGAQ